MLRGVSAAAASILGIVCSGFPNMALSDSLPGLVSFTFDDASRSQYEIGLSIAQEFGIRGTLFVVTRGVDDATEELTQARVENQQHSVRNSEANEAIAPTTWSMSWDEVRKFSSAGWELGSHTHTHPRLPELDNDGIIQEMDTALARIKAETGEIAMSFAPPFGDFDHRTLELAMARHHYHLLALGYLNRGQNPIDAVDPAKINRLGVYFATDQASICSEMQSAADQKTWFVVMFHGFSEEEPGEYEIARISFERSWPARASLRIVVVFVLLQYRKRCVL